MALSATERQNRYVRNLNERGGRRIPVDLDNRAVEALERLTASRNVTKRNLISELILAEAQRSLA